MRTVSGSIFSAIDDRAVGLLRPDHARIVVQQVVGEHDVVRGERLAVVPGHAVAQLDDDARMKSGAYS